MSRNYRVSWITLILIKRGWFTKAEYFAEFAPEYIDPNTREKQIGRDIRVVKDVFEDYGYGKVVYNLAEKRYEVLENEQ